MSAKIGFISYGLDREAGGIGRYTKELADALRQAGVHLSMLHTQKAKRNRDDIRLFGARLLPGLLTVGQVEIARAAHRQKLSIIHDPTGCAPLVFTRAQCVLTLHDVIPYIYPQTSTKLDWLIYHLWLPTVIRRIDAIITVSEQSKRDIVQYLSAKPEKITVIPEAASPLYRPIDPKQKEPRLLAHGIDFPYILYIGSIEARKNLIVLLEAYAQLRHWSKKWKLVIVGASKWKYTPVFDTLERLQLSSDVHFTGYIPEADLPAFYNGASLFVFPSLYEGFGLPVLEAMACGTPVIASNCSSLPEVTADAAVLIHPTDVNAITSAIRQILEEPDLAMNLREKGIAQAGRFSWERTARKTITIYEGLLNESLIS